MAKRSLTDRAGQRASGTKHRSSSSVSSLLPPNLVAAAIVPQSVTSGACPPWRVIRGFEKILAFFRATRAASALQRFDDLTISEFSA